MSSTFGRKKLIKDISSNTFQTAITQFFGLLIFYITSKYLSKDDFGEFNWSMAVGSTVIAIASLGLDLVFVRKVALGKDIISISGIHFFHTLAIALVLGSGVFLIQLLVPAFNQSHPLFFYIFLNLALANMANSFKLCMNGLEAYKRLAFLALFTNSIKFILIIALYLTHKFTILNVIYCYLITTAFEFVLAYVMLNKSMAARVKPLLKVKEYKYFILESLPQLGVVLFDSALARIDWILLGIVSTAAITAEYSFVYKIFELSKLPLLIISPILLTRFSKLFSSESIVSPEHQHEIQIFLKLELFIIMLIPLVLCCVWTPLIDYFTDNKYGAVNEINYYILVLCVPLMALINFLWTLGFVQGQLKVIMFITIGVSIMNILANVFLIPLYGAMGSAIAFLISTIFQLALFLKYIHQNRLKFELKNALLAFLVALLAVVCAKFLSNNVIFTTVMALVIYALLALLTKQIVIQEIKQVLRR
jgi:O-antigen/teichoic acid export membrane protein